MGNGTERTIQEIPEDWRLPAKAGTGSTLRRGQITQFRINVEIYTPRHQNTSFKVAAKSYNVATRTAELKQVGRFTGLLTSTCCNIFICNRINEMF
jgi:hypothetical protein